MVLIPCTSQHQSAVNYVGQSLLWTGEHAVQLPQQALIHSAEERPRSSDGILPGFWKRPLLQLLGGRNSYTAWEAAKTVTVLNVACFI